MTGEHSISNPNHESVIVAWRITYKEKGDVIPIMKLGFTKDDWMHGRVRVGEAFRSRLASSRPLIKRLIAEYDDIAAFQRFTEVILIEPLM